MALTIVELAHRINILRAKILINSKEPSFKTHVLNPTPSQLILYGYLII